MGNSNVNSINTMSFNIKFNDLLKGIRLKKSNQYFISKKDEKVYFININYPQTEKVSYIFYTKCYTSVQI